MYYNLLVFKQSLRHARKRSHARKHPELPWDRTQVVSVTIRRFYSQPNDAYLCFVVFVSTYYVAI